MTRFSRLLLSSTVVLEEEEEVPPLRGELVDIS